MAEKHALLVAIDKYRVAPLRFCEKDALSLRYALRQFGFVSPDVLANASTGQVKAKLAECADRVQPGDTFLFYFAGHGIYQGSNSYLVCADGSLEAPRGLTLSEVTELMDRMRATQKILICDACRQDVDLARGAGQPGMTGQMFGEFQRIVDRRLVPADEPAAAEVQEPARWYVLLSCSPGQCSWEADELQHGVFTHQLFTALDGLAASRRGGISLADVATRVIAGVDEWSKTHRGHTMSPYLVGSGAVNIWERDNGSPRAPRTGVNYIPVPAGVVTLAGRSHAVQEFLVASHPVTVETYRTIAELPQSPPANNPNYARGDLPITCVSWTDAMNWCTKHDASLPTEAQWEHLRTLNLPGAVLGPLLEWCLDGAGSPDSVRRVVRSASLRTTRALDDTEENLGFRCVRN